MNLTRRSSSLFLPVGVLLILSWHGGIAQETALPRPDAANGRKQISVLIRFGLKEEKPTAWQGTYRVTPGRIVATDGWRFAGNDYATASKFEVHVRQFFPRFWDRRGRDKSTLPIEPNGIILTLADLTRSAVLEVSTSSGDFTVPVGKLALGRTRQALEGKVDFRRLPTSQQIVTAPTEDGYPSALGSPDGGLQVTYIAFTHGEGFEKRPPIDTAPEDFSFLAKPTGGDQIMFTECQGDRWTVPIALSEPGGDLFGTAMARDGDGRLWVFWAANVDENWDLYATFREQGSWSVPLRVTKAEGSDFNHVAVTDAQGRIWLAWQHLGRTSSDICVASQEDGVTFGKVTVLADGPGNDWKPAIATATDGRIAVAWDSYERGNYDVHGRIRTGDQWEATRSIAATERNEARPSLAFDKQNRLWIAYESSPEGWGKDFGPYDQSSKHTALYRDRSLGVRVLQDGLLHEPSGDLNRAFPLPDGRPRWPKSGDRILAAGPKVAVDASGRLWLTARIRMTRFDSAVGSTWMTYLTSLEADGWRPAVMVPETDAFLHESPALVPAPRSGLYLVSCSDGRFRSAASFGPLPGLRRPRNKTLPPRSTRVYASYPDAVFNKEIAIADTGLLAPVAGDHSLKAVENNANTEPIAEARDEAKQVAAMRSYRADVGGKTLRLARGEFHRHTEISSDGGGDGSIFDMWRYGLDMASLDWIGNGDHDNGSGREISWWFTQKTTSLFTMPGAFTPLYTYERSCNYPDGHRNAVFAKRGIRPLGRLRGGKGKILDRLPEDADRPNTPDTQMFYRYLHQFDGICASHTSGTNMGTDWRDNDPKVEPIVEIYQGDRQNYERPGAPRSNTADYSIGGWRPLGFVSRALLKGYRLGFQSSSDHISTHMSYCNVWVKELTREALLEGMKLRRVYGSTDNIIADVRCAEHFMGEEFTVNKPPTLKVKLIGTAPFAQVVIVKDDQYVYSAEPNEQTVEFQWTDTAAKPGKTSYYYVRGTQVGETSTRKVRTPEGQRAEVELNNGEIVWVSPMWIRYVP